MRVVFAAAAAAPPSPRRRASLSLSVSSRLSGTTCNFNAPPFPQPHTPKRAQKALLEAKLVLQRNREQIEFETQLLDAIA